MSVAHAFSDQDRPESKALVVATSALQLALVVLVWLLALVPMLLIATGAAVFQAVKRPNARAPRTAVSQS